MKKKKFDNTKNAIRIQRAQVNDAPNLAKIRVESWQMAYREIVPKYFLKGLTIRKRVSAFREALINETEETYQAEEGNAVVGILTIGASRDITLKNTSTGQIWGIYLLPDYWRRGIGTFLSKEAEHIFASRGFKEIVLWVQDANAAAKKFYEAMGYLADGNKKTVRLGKELIAIRCHKVIA